MLSERDGRSGEGTGAAWPAPGWQPVRWLAMLMLMLVPPLAFVEHGAAQLSDPPVGSRLRVANTDGQRLNLRAGPSTSETVLARLDDGTELEVVGAARAAGGTRWIEVRAAGGQRGWIALEFATIVSTPAPTATPTPRVTPTPEPDDGEQAAAMQSITPTVEPTATPGPPVDVEARVKFPETSGREQEITVWVTRNGAPVPGAVVTATNEDGDDDPLERVFDPTDEDGRARRSFSIRRDKGTVRVILDAVAPDGGTGRTTVEYFRR